MAPKPWLINHLWLQCPCTAMWYNYPSRVSFADTDFFGLNLFLLRALQFLPLLTPQATVSELWPVFFSGFNSA